MALKINGETIDDEIIENESYQIKSYYESLGSVSCCEREAEFLAMAKDNIIGRVLLMQESGKRGKEIGDEEVDVAFQKLVDQHGATEHVLLEAGLTLNQEDVFREDLRANLRMESMLEEICGDGSPDEEVLKKYYEDNNGVFQTEEEVRASHIFKSVQQVEKKDEIYEGLREIRKRALAGEDFLGLVREFSDKPEDESDLGFFKRGDLMEEFEVIAFSMEIGDISPVFLTQWGYHLAKLTERKPPEPRPYEEVRDEVEHLFLMESRKQSVDGFVAGLKKKAVIEDDDPGDEGEAPGIHGND